MVQTIPASKIKMIVKTYDEVGLAFEDLAKGNLDAVMCDDPVAKYYANTKDEYRDKFHIGLVTAIRNSTVSRSARTIRNWPRS